MLIACVLLIATIATGLMTGSEVKRLSDRYISAAEELQVMAQQEDWTRAAETVEAYLNTWEETVPWLQMLINHEDVDYVTLALMRMRAGVMAQDQGTCYEACSELHEHAEHLYHRDSFTLANIL
ncbi:MAG: DUF4363 family protein [Clostridia bacterium]|nr:DUF4363 family protein [Clostridia bacterium]